jgi:2-oxo-4-hydroxy-4-carboxy-5-ureidoimidazoline decarboxylase
MNLAGFNSADADTARAALALCCVSERWIDGVIAGRPYATLEALKQHSDRIWRELGESDFLQAFEGHPKIGDVSSLRKKYAASEALAAGEQSSVAAASDDVIERLAAGNARYEKRFGFIFIVCATGKSAAEMLTLLEERLHNDRATELAIAAEEQRRILTLRLEKML